MRRLWSKSDVSPTTYEELRRYERIKEKIWKNAAQFNRIQTARARAHVRAGVLGRPISSAITPLDGTTAVDIGSCDSATDCGTKHNYKREH